MLVPDSRLGPQFLECSNDKSQSNLQACIICNSIYSIRCLVLRVVDPDPDGQKRSTNIEKSKKNSCFEVLDLLFWGVEGFSCRLCLL
jgi:hypothetical protein